MVALKQSYLFGEVSAVVVAELRRWYGLFFIGLAVAMVIVDVTIVNVAVPAIVGDLGIDATATQWTQEAYTLTLAALLLTAGRVADLLGRRRCLVGGIAVFVAGSVLAALAPTGAVLIGARVVQGIGGSVILPATLSLINATFRGRERATAFAVWGSVIGGAAAFGPLLGGWLTTEFSWRWAFWINLGFGAAAVAGIVAFVAESRQRDAERGLDIVGVLLSAVASAALVYGLIEGREQGWLIATSAESRLLGELSAVPVAFAVAVLAGIGFIRWQHRRSRTGGSALLDLSLFSVKSFARGNVVVFVVALGQLGLLFVLPIWLQTTLGYTATRTGLLLLPVAVGAFLAAATTPLLAQRWGAAGVLRFGLVAEICGLAGLAAVVGPDTTAWGLVPILALYGFGVGTADAQLPGVLLRDIPVDRSGQGSGVQSTAQELGSAMGIAILGGVLFASLAADLSDRLETIGLPPAARESITASVTATAGTVIPNLADPRVAEAARAAFSTGTRNAALAGAAFLVVGLLATAALPGDRRRPDAVGDGGPQPASSRTARAPSA
jgi:EmrB/QacA subfamily drug resistance transporter